MFSARLMHSTRSIVISSSTFVFIPGLNTTICFAGTGPFSRTHTSSCTARQRLLPRAVGVLLTDDPGVLNRDLSRGDSQLFCGRGIGHKQPGRDRVCDVLLSSDPFEIGRAVVQFVSVDMVYFQLLPTGALHPCLCHQPVDHSIRLGAIAV